MIEIIDKKRRKQKLTKEEIEYVITGYLDKTIPDYQMSSLLMAITINGMTMEETFALTDVMLKSGETIDLSFIKGTKVDKHSTGGIGDKTTLILAPLVASCGVPVAKMSGRGLGHTGGTIDKLEAIPGFHINLTQAEFRKQVNEIKVSIVGQSGNLVPADKALYALRDVTGTVESIPLIASSIMSKKIASGADKIVIDVKVGKGALMKNIVEGEKLAHLMVRIGKYYHKETVCVITNMEQPLGCNIGNALEVLESIEVLKGKGTKDLTDLVLFLATEMVRMGKDISLEAARTEVTNHLLDGSAYQKFEELVTRQGGDLKKITLAPKVFSIKSPKTGFVNRIDALKVGRLVHQIGAGRNVKTEPIDYGVGMVLSKKPGDFVTENEELAKVYLNQKDANLQEILDCFEITEAVTTPEKLIYEVVR